MTIVEAALDPLLVRELETRVQRCLETYRADPDRVLEDANKELLTMGGGYHRRQLYELIQNAADAIPANTGGRIHVILTEHALYCANEGEPIRANGIRSLLMADVSPKRASEIGRFGLGFKSVLEISQAPQFFSAPVSFEFHAERSSRLIREIVPDAAKTPVLRLAWPVDIKLARRDDRVLDELLEWATTVVKLPLEGFVEDWVWQEFESFPAEFLLFSSKVGTLVLSDRPGKNERKVSVTIEDGVATLDENGRSSQWKIFSTTHVLSDRARADAGDPNDRQEVPIMWAVPIAGRKGSTRSNFWAFFPTTETMTLDGILNAPWKTNNDRQNLLEGAFNKELLEVAAKLVASNLSGLSHPKDPGAFLSLLPARDSEPHSWAEGVLNAAVFQHVSEAACLPDQDGVLRYPTQIKAHPSGLPPKALQAWAASPEVARNWLHWSTENFERRYKVNRILDLAGIEHASVEEWLGAAVARRTAAGSAAAIRAVAEISAAGSTHKGAAIRCETVLTNTGDLVAPRPGLLFLPSDRATYGLSLVNSAIASDDETVAALRSLGIGPVDAASELRALLIEAQPRYMPPRTWEQFWELARDLGAAGAIDLLRELRIPTTEVKARTRAGGFRSVQEVLLPGEIVTEEPGTDDAIAVDMSFHASDVELLRLMGASSRPRKGFPVDKQPAWIQPFLDERMDEFISGIRTPQKPRRSHLELNRCIQIGPLAPLFEASEEARARITNAVLELIQDETQWILGHESRSDFYPSMEVESPYLWLIKNEGRLDTSQGTLPVHRAVGTQLSAFQNLLPVARCSIQQSELLGLPSTLDSVPKELLEQSLAEYLPTGSPESVGDAYAAVSRHVAAPVKIRSFLNGKATAADPCNVLVVLRYEDREDAESGGRPYVFVTDRNRGRQLIENWGLRKFDSAEEKTLRFSPAGDEQTIDDVFPGLRTFLTEEQRSYTMLPCSDLYVETPSDSGLRSEPRSLELKDGVIYWDASFSPGQLLPSLVDRLDLTIGPDQQSGILKTHDEFEQELLDTEIRKRQASIAAASTLAEKLLRAVGPDSLQARLPYGLLETFRDRNGRLKDIDRANLALSTYRYGVLKEYREALAANGLQPPQRWGRNQRTRQFAQSLGFPDEYAGFDERKPRDAMIEVDGNVALPELHPFQKKIRDRMRDHLRSTKDRRAMLSLPTGAGKTRVTVQSLVEAIAGGDVAGPVLWVAQSDELCEQAVQTWSEVWRAIGPNFRLRISRLWGNNSATPPSDGAHVVISTFQKLNKCMPGDSYEWLFEQVGCLVIDEAHGSITPSYTRLLERVGSGRSHRHDRTTLLGLTATPFRGNNKESERLVGRYDAVRIDRGILGSDPYGYLQELEILAQVDHELLDGSVIELADDERKSLEQYQVLPPAAEKRLGNDLDRNSTLIDSIKDKDPSWPILVFATSVDHAKTLAALLSYEGVQSAAIWGELGGGERRRYIEDFKAGKIQVLTNYNVLTTGFDAPAIRALYVARPTFSPVLYQQMIGRGLRGKANRGKDRCLIVNVADNVAKYGRELAFREFEYLWNRKLAKD